MTLFSIGGNAVKRCEVIPPGEKVKVGGDVTGVVVSVMVVGTDWTVRYEVAWWKGESRQTAWVEEVEVERVEATNVPCRIGFGVRS